MKGKIYGHQILFNCITLVVLKYNWIIPTFNKGICEIKISIVHTVVPECAISISVNTWCSVAAGESMKKGNPLQILCPIDSFISMIF